MLKFATVFLGSMQNQMEQRLSSMSLGGFKSPGLPASPSARTFGSSLNRQSIAGDSSSFLSPESANNIPTGNGDAAATLGSTASPTEGESYFGARYPRPIQ